MKLSSYDKYPWFHVDFNYDLLNKHDGNVGYGWLVFQVRAVLCPKRNVS